MFSLIGKSCVLFPFVLCFGSIGEPCDPQSLSGKACPAGPVSGGGEQDASELLQTAVRVGSLAPQTVDNAHEDALRSKAKVAGSPEETVNTYCDAAGVARMHGYVGQNGSLIRGQQEALMDDIMDDVAEELTDNNIDQMVKDIFSFYFCVRWVPDEVFWKVAEQELTAEILESVVDKGESSTKAIGELYQNFKFVPVLCSQNLKVYEETSKKDSTYFTNFRERVKNLSAAVSSLEEGPVWAKLKKADELFCGSDKMNSLDCDANFAAASFLNEATSWLGDWGFKFDTKEDKWQMMEDIFKQFKYHGTDAAWNEEFARWKKQFPYHSFISKPQGVDNAHSPTSSQRFLVCFGKRVASELHRRPRGDHIITDQNNVGCHGWWDGKQVVDMLKRTVALWKPPTCDLAEMSYVMKKQILQQFMRMNEQLFDALPSMVSDEELEASGKLDELSQGPPVYNVPSVSVGGTEYFDGTRVAAITDITYENPAGRRRRCWSSCEAKVKKGHAGTVTVTESGSGNVVSVLWDGGEHGSAPHALSPSTFTIVPHEYGMPVSGILDTVAGWAYSAAGSIGDFLQTFWGGQYTSLAAMMSGSIAKWVVCPLAANISLSDLDKNLGTEDAAFQEFVNEAYSKWTGYEAKMPGEQCAKEDDVLLASKFPGCQVCEISELHVDLPEKYFKEDGQQDDFMCPLKAPLDPAEQLDIFKKKKGTCLLHMTAKQNRQQQWHYNGHHPARKQNNVQANVPLPEFELVKLLDIATSGGPKQISYGRTCTVEEETANPRFCGLNEFYNPWDSILDMSEAVSGMLEGAVGMPVGAVADLISNVQQLLSKNTSEDAATFIGEKSWNALMGLGRLAHNTATATQAKSGIYDLPASEKRHARLEAELFGLSHGGDFVHGMSYQYSIGANNRSSNARQRYRRYAVTCPCDKFDPGMELALKWRWTEVTLRAFREGLKHNPTLLDKTTADVRVRSEAKLFFRDNAQDQENSTWFEYSAAIDAGTKPPSTEPCRKTGSWYSGYQCVPTDTCTLLEHTYSSECVRTPISPKGPWRVVWDKSLESEVGGNPIGEPALDSLKAITITLYCGPKKTFGATGGPTQQSKSLKQCMEDGVKANAAMKSEKPWKLYFPDEVIVVATFGTISSSKCLSAHSSTESKLCSGASKEADLDSHLNDIEKTSTGGVYHGIHTGSGYPKGTLKEVTLRPEDILEVTGMLV